MGMKLQTTGTVKAILKNCMIPGISRHKSQPSFWRCFKHLLNLLSDNLKVTSLLCFFLDGQIYFKCFLTEKTRGALD